MATTIGNGSTSFSRNTRLLTVTQKRGQGDLNEVIDMQQSTVWSLIHSYCIGNDLKIKNYSQPKENESLFVVDTFDGSRYQFKISEAIKL